MILVPNSTPIVCGQSAMTEFYISKSNQTRSLMDSELFLKFMVKMLVTSPLSAFELMWIRAGFPFFFYCKTIDQTEKGDIGEG